MKNLIIAASITCALLALATAPASAQWYAAANGGIAFVESSRLTESGPGVTGDGELSFDTGYEVSGAVGYAFGNLRAEGEISYRRVDTDTLRVNSVTLGSFTAVGLGTFAVDGSASALALMGNVWYDIPTGTRWVPFVGGGVGATRVNYTADAIGGAPKAIDETDTVFAYQFGAGIAYQVSPRLLVELAYRYFATSDPEFRPGLFTDHAEIHTHDVEVGVRYIF